MHVAFPLKHTPNHTSNHTSESCLRIIPPMQHAFLTPVFLETARSTLIWGESAVNQMWMGSTFFFDMLVIHSSAALNIEFLTLL